MKIYLSICELLFLLSVPHLKCLSLLFCVLIVSYDFKTISQSGHMSHTMEVSMTVVGGCQRF
jgi:hypothetical protein